MLQTMRFSIEDKADYVYYKSKMNKKLKASIENSANEAARRINSNADLNTAKELIGIKNAANEIAESQMKANYIIESAIQANTDRIVDSIEDLRALFDIRSARIIWLLEQNHKEFMYLLGKIYETMITPTETDAREKTKWAIKAYNDGLFDEAIKFFNISKELYPFDFMVYQFLGNIYLFEKRDPKNALENYKLVLKFLVDRSSYYSSLAFLHIGLSHYEMGDYQDAYIATSIAVQKTPTLSEANYRCAQNCSKLGKYDDAINNLRKAIKADRGYLLKTLAEKDFEPMSSKLKDFIEGLTKEERDTADIELEKSSQLIKKLKHMDDVNDAKQKLEEGLNLRNAGTYLNYRDAVYKAYVSQKALVDSLITRLSGDLPSLEGQFNELHKKFVTINPSLKDYRKIMQISAPFALLGCFGIHGLIYNIYYPALLTYFLPLNILEWLKTKEDFLTIFLFVMCPIFIPIFIYCLTKYISLFPHGASNIELSTLDKTLKKYRKNLAIVKSEKEKLNIDKDAEKLGPIEYEKYLRKTYG